jgi:uncharacterized protein YbjT (DUF2867 family)
MDTSMVMQTRKVATVFGGAGFIGRYLVPHLVRQGYVIRVAGRDPERGALLKPLGSTGQIVPLYAPVTDAAAIGRAIDGARPGSSPSAGPAISPRSRAPARG